MARKKKNKFYVVWEGAERGILDSWERCLASVKGHSNARYKGFKTREAAERALEEGAETHWGKGRVVKTALSQAELDLIGAPPDEALCVDAAHSSVTKEMEYRGVTLPDGVEVFRQGPYPGATGNLGEFLAIVHGLAWLKQHELDQPIYSDSKVAMAWVREKLASSDVLDSGEAGTEVAALVRRAERWLASSEPQVEIRKWETKAWGEIPADFGRK